MKRIVLAVLAVFVAWTALDLVIHGVVLRCDYEATAALWRPMNEMKMNLMHLVVLVSAVAFTCLYAWFIGTKNWGPALRTGWCSVSRPDSRWASGRIP